MGKTLILPFIISSPYHIISLSVLLQAAPYQENIVCKQHIDFVFCMDFRSVKRMNIWLDRHTSSNITCFSDLHFPCLTCPHLLTLTSKVFYYSLGHFVVQFYYERKALPILYSYVASSPLIATETILVECTVVRESIVTFYLAFYPFHNSEWIKTLQVSFSLTND